MPMWMFLCCLRGSKDKYRDETALALMGGYYSGYYSNAGKRAKKPDQIWKALCKQSTPQQRVEVDMDEEVAKFKRMEQQFKERLGG